MAAGARSTMNKTPHANLKKTRMRRRGFPWLRTLLVLLFGAGAILALHTHGKLLRNDWYPFLVWMAAPGVMAWMLWTRAGRPQRVSPARWAPLLLVTAWTLAYVFSSAVFHKWFYFLQWAPEHARLVNTGIARFAMWTVILTPFYARGMRRTWLIPLLVLLASEALCAGVLLRHTGGSALYRTDHPSFMFRLWEFARNFPRLVLYVPQWNGGVIDYVSVTSGTGAPGLVLWPLFHFAPVHSVYTVAWVLLFLVIVPWIGVASVRALGGDRTAAFAGGVLALGISQHFFLWALHFGTIGAAFTASMTMPVCALGFRVVWRGRREWWTGAALVASGFLLLMWPPGGIVGLGVALATLAAVDRWHWRKLRFLALCALAILVLFSPWLLVILTEGRSVVQFVMTPGAAEAAGMPITRALLFSGAKHLVAHVQEGSPLLIFFGLVATAACLDRRLARWFLPIFIVLAAVTGWAREFRPHSQLSRMSIPLFFAAVPPAAVFIGKLLRVRDRRFAVVQAGLVAMLIVSGINTAKICANKGLARYVVISDELQGLVDWIREETPPTGRVLFAGSCVHGYGGGNVAYLPVLTGREMMAVDYYGFPPEQVLYEYPPREFRCSDEAMRLFFDAYGVTHLVTYHDNWKAAFRSQPERYEEMASFGRITVFARKDPASIFWKGAGRVTAEVNHIAVDLDDLFAEAVISYNWTDGLHAPAPVELYPHAVTNGLTLIGIRPNGRSAFTIDYRRPWRPAVGEADVQP